MRLGEMIQHWREIRGMSQSGVAREAQLSASIVSRMESGSLPRRENMQKVARALRAEDVLMKAYFEEVEQESGTSTREGTVVAAPYSLFMLPLAAVECEGIEIATRFESEATAANDETDDRVATALRRLGGLESRQLRKALSAAACQCVVFAGVGVDGGRSDPMEGYLRVAMLQCYIGIGVAELVLYQKGSPVSRITPQELRETHPNAALLYVRGSECDTLLRRSGLPDFTETDGIKRSLVAVESALAMHARASAMSMEPGSDGTAVCITTEPFSSLLTDADGPVGLATGDPRRLIVQHDVIMRDETDLRANLDPIRRWLGRVSEKLADWSETSVSNEPGENAPPVGLASAARAIGMSPGIAERFVREFRPRWTLLLGPVWLRFLAQDGR